jgi:hypothetical protein
MRNEHVFGLLIKVVSFQFEREIVAIFFDSEQKHELAHNDPGDVARVAVSIGM